MLPAERRVRRPADFSAAVRAGRRCGAPGLVVHLRRTGDATPARAGFVVSRVVGTAVVRNRVRRQLRHQIAAHLETLPAGTDLVIRVLPGAAALTRRERADLLATLVQRAQRSAVPA